MGKLLDALKKRAKELADYKAQPHPRYEDDPQKGYEYILRVNELNYQLTQAGRLLTAAFSKMSPEQQLQFLEQTLNDDKKTNFAQAGYTNVLADVNDYYHGGTKIRAFFENEDSFGRPLAEVLAGMEKILKQEELAEVNSELSPNASPAARAVKMYSKMKQGQRDRLFEELVTPERKARYRAEFVMGLVKNGRIGSVLLNNNSYKQGKTWIDAVEQIEQAMDPRLAEQTAEQIDKLVPPHLDPNKTITPYADRIAELRAGLSPEDPKNTLLDKVGKILVYPSENYRQYLDKKSTDDSVTVSLDNATNAYSHQEIERFVAQKMGAHFQQKLPHNHSLYTGHEFYDTINVHPIRRNAAKQPIGANLTREELRELKRNAAGESPLSPEVRKAVKEIVGGIEEMGEKKYWIDPVVVVEEVSGQIPTKVRYKDEQGDKKYAFWPLVNAKRSLADAVQAGDWDRIQSASDEYERCKAITDKMMAAANRTAKDPIFTANLNSTREELDHTPNRMPTEYLEDYAGHSRVNGLFMLYAASKNSGQSVDRLLDDPAGALHDFAQEYISKKLLSAQKGKPMGARLVHCFDRSLQTRVEASWRSTLGILGRAMNAVNGLIPNEADRIKNAGRNYCAAAAANYEVGRETVPWWNLTGAGRDQKVTVTQLAMLLPENEFNLQDVGMKIDRDDWYKALNPLTAIARLQQEHKLDYGALVERSKQIIAEADAALQQNDAGKKAGKGMMQDSVANYQAAALRNYYQIMRTVPPEQCETEGYQQMAAHAAELQDALIKREMKDNASFNKDRTKIDEQLQILDKKKSGWFLDEQNSPEYTRMVKQIKLLNLKLDMLAGKPLSVKLSPESLEKLRKANTADMIIAAKRACYNYASLKTKEGKGSIVHEAGRERRDYALKLFESIGKLGDHLGVRSPANELKDHAALQVLRRRSSSSWEKRNAETYAARMIYAMSLQYRGIPEDTQADLMEEEPLNKAVENIRRNPVFRKMVENEGPGGLAKKIVQGASALSEAYMKASSQVAQPEADREPAPQRTNEEKIEFWRKQENPGKTEDAPHL